MRRPSVRGGQAVDDLVRRVNRWASTQGFSGDVARQVCDTELCDTTTRQAALSLLLEPVSEGTPLHLSGTGLQLAKTCVAALVKCLADRKNPTALALRYRVCALRDLKATRPQLSTYPFLVIRGGKGGVRPRTFVISQTERPSPDGATGPHTLQLGGIHCKFRDLFLCYSGKVRPVCHRLTLRQWSAQTVRNILLPGTSGFANQVMKR